MKGVVITNGYYESEYSRHQAARTAEELRSLGAEVSVVKNDQAYIITDKNTPDLSSGDFLNNDRYEGLDFAVFYDKDVNLARHLENNGVRVYNPSDAIEDADDKIRTAEILASNNISIPRTIPAPKRYYAGVDEKFLDDVAKKLGFPMVMKLAHGSLGKEVFLVNNREELSKEDGEYSDKDRLYQEFCSLSKGESYRVIVVGGKYLCAMHLTNETDFRSNAAQGGRAENVDLPEEYIKVAERAARALNCDYCGVDLFCHQPMVIELNSNAYFMSMEKTSGINVAKEYARYIIEGTHRG